MPSKIRKNGKNRIKANVMVKGVTRSKLFPDATKKSFREALLWEEETRKQLEKEMEQTGSVYLTIGDWIDEYLDEAENRFVEKTFKEKRSAFIRFVQKTGVSRDIPVGDISREMCREFLKEQSVIRSGNATNKDRKNLAAAWKWGRENLTGWPEVENPFRSVKKFPEDRDNRYVPPESDFWKVLEVSEGQDTVMLMTFLHTAGDIQSQVVGRGFYQRQNPVIYEEALWGSS